MRRLLLATVFVVVIAAAMIVAACVSSNEGAAATSGAATATAAPVTAEGDALRTSPASDRDRGRQEAWRAAIRGLRFDDERLVVEQPDAAPDASRAARLVAAGDAALTRNETTDAVRNYAAAVRAAPDRLPPYLSLADGLVRKGKVDLAIATYRTVLERAPDTLAAHIGLAESLARVQRRDEAIAAMEDAVALDPDLGRGHERLAIWQYYAGDDEAAWHHVREAERVGHPVPPQFLALLRGRKVEGGG